MRYLLLCLCSALTGLQGFSQLGVGSGQTLFIGSGTTFFVDSLVLIPNANTNISNTNLTHDGAFITGPGGTKSIMRVYRFSNPITFTGDAGIVFDDAELNGNPKASLQIAYNSNGVWTTTNNSTVTGNFVSYPASGGSIYNQLTAIMNGVVLPVTFTRFTAARESQYVQLNWAMGDIDGLTGFDIEFSNDGRTWNNAGRVPAIAMLHDFSFQHRDLNFTQRYYRIVASEANGHRTYTRLVGVRNGGEANSVHIIRKGTSTVVYFNGAVPNAVQLYDMNGRMLMNRGVQQQQVEITGMVSGTYIIHYVVDGQKMSRKVQL